MSRRRKPRGITSEFSPIQSKFLELRCIFSILRRSTISQFFFLAVLFLTCNFQFLMIMCRCAFLFFLHFYWFLRDATRDCISYSISRLNLFLFCRDFRVKRNCVTRCIVFLNVYKFCPVPTFYVCADGLKVLQKLFNSVTGCSPHSLQGKCS
jgi:hypothetical protein